MNGISRHAHFAKICCSLISPPEKVHATTIWALWLVPGEPDVAIPDRAEEISGTTGMLHMPTMGRTAEWGAAQMIETLG
jgi:hypothetical protein